MAVLINRHLRKSEKWNIGWLHVVALMTIECVVLITTYDLVLRMLYEAGGPFTWDSPHYWAIGRGILNGLLPYRDLFETKPPGIFLLSAVSFRLFDSPILGHVIESLSIPLYPALLSWQAWHFSNKEKKSGYARQLCLLLAALSGTLIGLYVMERSGEFQVESFGALFSLLFLFVIASEKRMSTLRTFLASIFLLCAIGMKEPFVLTTFGGAMILCSDRPKRLISTFVVPFLFAVAVGSAVMLSLGYWEPYFTIYLPELLGKEILDKGSMWSHFSAWQTVFHDLEGYAPGFGLLIGVSMLVFVLRPFPKKASPFIILSRCCSLLFAVYLGITAVAMKGDFLNHHFAFAAPIYLALMMAINMNILKWKTANPIFRFCVSTFILLLLWSSVLQPRYDYRGRLDLLRQDANAARQVAHKIDAILTTCDLQRYLFLGVNGPQPYGYTQHSPLGPIFFQIQPLLEPSRSYFRRTFLGNLSSTRLIVRSNNELSDLQPMVDEYIAKNFSRNPWPCAGVQQQKDTPGYEFLYRQNP